MSKLTLRWLLVALAAFFVLLLAGCSRLAAASSASAGLSANTEVVTLTRGPLAAVIGATGTVRSRQTAQIAWQTSGKVSAVMVQLGQKLQADEVLAELDPTSLSQNILQAQSDLISARSALEDLKKPQPLKVAQAESALADAQDALDTLLNPSDYDMAQAELNIITAQDAVDNAQKQVDYLKYGRGTQEQIANARATYVIAQDELDRVQGFYDRTDGDPTQDAGKALALNNLEAAKTKRDRALAALNWYLGTPSEDEIAEKNTKLAAAQAQLKEAQDKLETLKNPQASDISLAEAKIEDARQALADAQAGASADDLAIAQNRITLNQATINQARLTAPFAGTITSIQALPGDMVAGGRTAFRIDDLSQLFIDLDVSEIDIYQLRAGQPVSVTFDAILDKQYSGVVTEIGLVGTADQGVVYFPVTVQLTSADQEVKPGMTAVANVIINQVEDVLQAPNRAVQLKDGQYFIYVMQPKEGGGEQSVEVIVKVGLVSDSMTEIISDAVKEGDRILASVPTSTESGFIGGPMGGGR